MGYTGFKLRYGDYAPETLKNPARYSPDELRKEYQRLYRVGQKRLRRFEEAGRTDAAAYRINRDMLASIELRDVDLPYALAEIHDFLANPRGTVRELKRWEGEMVEKLHDVGLNFVNKKNLRQFGDFMDTMRAQKLDKIYGSERAAELFGALVGKGLDPAEVEGSFSDWLDNTKALQKLPKHRDPARRTLDAYRDEIREAERKDAKRKAKKAKRKK